MNRVSVCRSAEFILYIRMYVCCLQISKTTEAISVFWQVCGTLAVAEKVRTYMQ